MSLNKVDKILSLWSLYVSIKEKRNEIYTLHNINQLIVMHLVSTKDKVSG